VISPKLTQPVLLCALLGAACDRQPDPNPAPSTSARAPAAGPSLLNPSAYQLALRDVKTAAGSDIKALELAVHPGRMVLQAQDPKQPGRVMQYEYRDGKVLKPISVRLAGTGKLEDNLFPLDEVALDELPRLAKEAVLELDPDNGKVDYVLVRRNLPHTMDIQIRTYIDSPAKDGYVDADERGRLLPR
jgi:hypothetical protein